MSPKWTEWTSLHVPSFDWFLWRLSVPKDARSVVENGEMEVFQCLHTFLPAKSIHLKKQHGLGLPTWVRFRNFYQKGVKHFWFVSISYVDGFYGVVLTMLVSGLVPSWRKSRYDICFQTCCFWKKKSFHFLGPDETKDAANRRAKRCVVVRLATAERKCGRFILSSVW